jgi:hypothetical protein
MQLVFIFRHYHADYYPRRVSVSPAFVELVRRALAACDSNQRELGRALDLSPQVVSKAVNGKGYPFGPVNCFKLAAIVGVPGVDVLRAAGKTDLAEAIEAEYPRRALPVAHRLLLEDWDRMSDVEQRAARLLIARVAGRRPR